MVSNRYMRRSGYTRQHLRSPSKRRLIRVIAVLSVAAILIGAFQLRYLFSASVQVPEESAPSSVKPTPEAVAEYTVAANHPRYISIPALHIVSARVLQMGLLKSNRIGSPPNIYDAGWYQHSAEPGATGAMFIYGHVASLATPGLFYDLHTLERGDTITIERGDGQKVSYIVALSKVYPANEVDMHAVLSPIKPNRPGLNLMTCTGQVIKGTHNYTDRLVIFATIKS